MSLTPLQMAHRTAVMFLSSVDPITTDDDTDDDTDK